MMESDKILKNENYKFSLKSEIETQFDLKTNSDTLKYLGITSNFTYFTDVNNQAVYGLQTSKINALILYKKEEK